MPPARIPCMSIWAVVAALAGLSLPIQADEPTLARLSFWIPAAQIAGFESAYAERLKPLLEKHGLNEASQRSRVTADTVFTRLFEIENPAAVADHNAALNRDSAWQETLVNLGSAWTPAGRGRTHPPRNLHLQHARWLWHDSDSRCRVQAGAVAQLQPTGRTCGAVGVCRIPGSKRASVVRHQRRCDSIRRALLYEFHQRRWPRRKSRAVDFSGPGRVSLVRHAERPESILREDLHHLYCSRWVGEQSVVPITVSRSGGRPLVWHTHRVCAGQGDSVRWPPICDFQHR